MVSIVLNSYNGAQYIEQQINSILAQSYPNFELVIWDDHSTDNTYSIAQKYQKLDPRVRIFQNQRNLGLMNSYLAALAHVKGNYVVLADNDNVWVPNRLELQVNYLQSHPDVALVYSDCYVCDQDLNIINTSFLERIHNQKWSVNHTNTTNLSFAKFLDVNHIPGVSIMFDHQLLPYAKKTPPTIIHDHWLALVAASLFKIGFVNQPLVYYRLHSNNLVGLSSNSYLSFVSKITNPSFTAKYIKDKQNFIKALDLLAKLLGSSQDKKLVRQKVTELRLLISLASSTNVLQSISRFYIAAIFLIDHRRYDQIKYVIFLFFQQLLKPPSSHV